MEIIQFEIMGLSGLSSNPFNLVKEQAVERERRKQSIGACPHHTLASSLHFYPLYFSPFSFLFLCSLFSSLFSVSFLSCYFSHLFFLTLSDCLSLFLSFFLLPLYCAQLRPFYSACRNEFYCFTPQLLLPQCRCPSKTTLVCRLPSPTTTMCWPCHIPFPDKRVLFCFLAFRDIPIQIRIGYSLLLTPMACTL